MLKKKIKLTAILAVLLALLLISCSPNNQARGTSADNPKTMTASDYEAVKKDMDNVDAVDLYFSFDAKNSSILSKGLDSDWNFEENEFEVPLDEPIHISTNKLTDLLPTTWLSAVGLNIPTVDFWILEGELEFKINWLSETAEDFLTLVKIEIEIADTKDGKNKREIEAYYGKGGEFFRINDVYYDTKPYEKMELVVESLEEFFELDDDVVIKYGDEVLENLLNVFLYKEEKTYSISFVDEDDDDEYIKLNGTLTIKPILEEGLDIPAGYKIDITASLQAADDGVEIDVKELKLSLECKWAADDDELELEIDYPTLSLTYDGVEIWRELFEDDFDLDLEIAGD